MGFKLEINGILRTNDFPDPKVGQEYSFEKSGNRVYFDNIEIWLIKEDWTAQAEIKITEQKRVEGKVTGKFIVKYVYNEEESIGLTKIFRRMYGWD